MLKSFKLFLISKFEFPLIGSKRSAMKNSFLLAELVE